jgi:hypothetical protein
MTKRSWLSGATLAIAAAAVASYQFGNVAAEVPVLSGAEGDERCRRGHQASE